MDKAEISKLIIQKALESGASLAGIANVEDLKKMPSFVMMPKRPHIDRVGAVENTTGLPEGVVDWPEEAKSVLAIAYFHPEDDEYMDCWIDWKNPPGNNILIKIMKEVREYIEAEMPEVWCKPMNYYVEKGGVWLKDTCKMAGIGIVGKNNLMLTKEYGSRVRLRAMYLGVDLPSTGPIDWDPCANCQEFCRKACPQNAFSEVIYNPDDYDGLTQLPGQDGSYSLFKCDVQMGIDEDNEMKGEFDIPKYGHANSILKYCRACELACPHGRKV